MNMKRIPTLLILLTVSVVTMSFFPLPTKTNGGSYFNYSIPLKQLVPPTADAHRFSVIVQKSSYTLFVKYNGRLVKSYPCVFGESPIGDKRMEGDNRTPEGNFYLSDIREHFIWGYFLEIDYPNHNSWLKHEEAKFNRAIPDTASIGGDLGLHGVVEGFEHYIDTKNNWTEGCVSLKNRDIIELAENLPIGTPIKIIY